MPNLQKAERRDREHAAAAFFRAVVVAPEAPKGSAHIHHLALSGALATEAKPPRYKTPVGGAGYDSNVRRAESLPWRNDRYDAALDN